ncbi:DUF6684 family protein [Haloarchaeobius baliensis]|uniref:DUF6684 family protein n=1 Tax=Haloarchaeobius baliensis TaxID=1670458 RepID=UPI003F88386B
MEQDRTIFDKDTFLDLTVNIIPLFIMAFFFVLFLPMVYGPFGWDSTYSLLQIGLILVPFVLLAILTYFSAVAIEGDERESEAREAAEAEAPEAEAPEIHDDEFGSDSAESGVAMAVDADEEDLEDATAEDDEE